MDDITLELAAGTADHTLTHEGTTLVVKDVPADVCDNCGEAFFDADVTDQLVVDVRKYAAA